jgi:hypothetical protein
MKTLNTTLAAGATLASLLAASPALALDVGGGLQVGARTGTGSTTIETRAQARAEAKTQVLSTREDKARDRGEREVDRRITILTDLNAKVQDMGKVSGAGKDAIAGMVQAQITALEALKAKIGSDASTTLKADLQSITRDYRIFALIIPQGHIAIAADKIHASASLMTTLSGKLSTRLTDAASGGKDVAKLQATLSGIAAKIADANATADAAVALTADLKPDNGDQSVMASNKAALKAARDKIQAALKTLKDVRGDLHDVIIGLKDLKLEGQATTSAALEQQ